MKKLANYAILSTLVFIMSIAFVVIGAKGQIKPYYSGDAVYSRGKVVFGSMNNDGVLELFTYSDNAIQRGAVIKSSEAFLPLSAKKRIYDFALTDEGGKTFVYTAEGKKLSKYDISDINTPVFINQVLEKNGDWYVGIKKYDDRLMTVGTKEVKLWNHSLQNIDNFKILNEDAYNVGISDDGKYIFNINDDSVDFFDTTIRGYAHSAAIRVGDSHFRKSFYDMDLAKLFVVDDEKVNQFSTNGTLMNSYNHISSSGYDVDSSQDSNYLYMTDGMGVVKLNKADLSEEDWAFTTNINDKEGGWAMGLKVVDTGFDEKLVVFNNNGIIVMDDDLEVLGSVNAIEGSSAAFIEEPLSLSVDKTAGTANTPVLLSGAGFAYNEDVEIVFANEAYITRVSDSGRFRVSINVPSVLPAMTDIKVTGKASKLTYSIAFDIR